MILFWLICTALVGIALAFVLPTLLERTPNNTSEDEKREANLDVYRDQLSELEADLRNGIISPEQHQQDRDDIERRLLDDFPTMDHQAKKAPPQVVDRGPAYAVALGIPAIAVALYLLLGNSAVLSGAATPATSMNSSGPNGQMSQQQIEGNVAKLATRLEKNPDDAEGWVMLARSYTTLEKYGDASNAYAKAAVLKPNDVDLLTEFAFALAMTNGRQLQGQPYELIKKALRLEPENAKALELAGSAEFQAKNYKQAIDYWQKILDKAPPGSELATTVLQNINEAKRLSGANNK